MMRRLVITLVLLTASAFGAESQKDPRAYKAREIRKSDIWINASPMTLKSLKGKVVMIDFWAFDCEPCVQAMPHVVDLYDKYSKDGLVIIGIHTPRADYERDIPKLREAIGRMNIKFPVVVDDKQKMFRDYLCDLWPSQFVIDRNGTVRYSHGGVGRYDDVQQVIERLLKAD